MIKGGGGASGGGGLPAVGRWSAGGGGKGANGWQGDGSPSKILVVSGAVIQDPYNNEGWSVYTGPTGIWVPDGSPPPPWADRAAAIMDNDADTLFLGSGSRVGLLGTAVNLSSKIGAYKYRVRFVARTFTTISSGALHFALKRDDGLVFRGVGSFDTSILSSAWVEYYYDIDCNGDPTSLGTGVCPNNGLWIDRHVSYEYCLMTYAEVIRL